VDEDDDMKEK